MYTQTYQAKFIATQPPANIYLPEIVPYPSNQFNGGVWKRISSFTLEELDPADETSQFFFRLENPGKFIESFDENGEIRIVTAELINAFGNDDDRCRWKCYISDDYIDVKCFNDSGEILNYFIGATFKVTIESNENVTT